MAETCILTFGDPDSYSAGFADACINLTITGAGDFKARLTRLKLKDLEVSLCCENLPRFACVSLPTERTFLSFPVDADSLISDGFTLRSGDVVLHGRGRPTHQQTNGACQWGLIALSPGVLGSCSKALTGRTITPPHTSKILRPAPAEALRFQRLFAKACRLAERQKLAPEAARALERELLHATINCLAANETGDNPKTRLHHGAVIARFEEAISKRFDQKLSMSALCAEIGVPERTLRMCCTEFFGVSPTRYLLLRRLNKARAALRRADPSTTSVSEVARNHQFLELGRFAVTYRITFGESPSVTLQQAPQS
ncbi:helix-turn-helix transcriptional regulator [Bradyrhizobium sp. CCGUVB23]|uniref:helix-turn-helix transcriptional regulator n=1 Tax=Bradyrhizobium sp. CCGUVB23 TaxID=2949630 RepID=UPI0020B19EDA|nr:helix-turn-helix transcriptional regulator [Bradyrhizobium sp. CCGUVB23]MCP3467505.1 helix-turn-helix domain-containing protein [Bradyrhizobium sp. CCGUVB23]